MTLAPDDKQWISELLEEKLERFVSGKLESLEAGFSGKLESLEAGFSGKLDRVEAGFFEKLERLETKLLTAFHDWSQPVNLRMRTHSADLRALQMEVEALQDRVTKLEERSQ